MTTIFIFCCCLFACQDFDPGLVIARVDDSEITAGEAMYMIRNRIGDRTLSDPQERKIRAETLEHLVRRRLVFKQLQQAGAAADPELVNLQIDRLKKRLSAANQSLEQFLSEKQLSPEAYFFEQQWLATWREYTRNRMDESAVQQFFNQNRRQFDGTEINAAHIVKLYPGANRDRQQFIASATRELTETRTKIITGELTWEQATQSESDAPSKQKGGALGWIGFEGPMSPRFNQAAFQLKLGEVSQPVATNFGVHLIKCQEIRIGKIGFRDAYPKVRARLMEQAFNELADARRPETTIEYFDHWPHYVDGLLKPAGSGR